ncbi:thioredoxin [Spirosoma sp. HMF3257]|uniref:Thioredoxin n=2 Tax=Spirosoma telluris TaxID=2183553 RepID=A0A327NT17_9BACT|nr:thioredoxin [Spirosoma telluris]RAI78530.1 thioredoxin [Spirosoma telluris]
MKLGDPSPILVPARSAVLLIFMPSDQENRQQRAALLAMTDWLQKRLGDLVRIHKIDQVNYPDVVQSFDIINTPTFVLIRQGIELWRQEGMPDEAVLANLPQHLSK